MHWATSTRTCKELNWLGVVGWAIISRKEQLSIQNYIVALTFNQGTLYKNLLNALSDLHSGVHMHLQGT